MYTHEVAKHYQPFSYLIQVLHRIDSVKYEMVVVQCMSISEQIFPDNFVDLKKTFLSTCQTE